MLSKISAYNNHIAHNTFCSACPHANVWPAELVNTGTYEIDVWTQKLHSVTQNLDINLDIDNLYFPFKDDGHGLKFISKWFVYEACVEKLKNICCREKRSVTISYLSLWQWNQQHN